MADALLGPLLEKAQAEGHFPPGDWRPLWLPRDRGRAVALIFARGAGKPELAVKLEPLPGRSLGREREVLERLSLAGGLQGGTPRVLDWREVAGRVALTTDVLPGRPLKRTTPWQLRAAINTGVDWLIRFNRAAGLEWVEPTAGRERHVRPHLEAYLRNYVASPAAREALGAAPAEVRHPLPLVLRHGDFNTANVLWRRGRVGVIDWELAAGPDPAGPDLVYWLHSCQPGNMRLSEQRFRRAFFTPGVAADAARRYFDSLEVEPALRWPLFLLGWVIQANDKRRWLPEGFETLDDRTANKDFALAYVSRGMCQNVEWACAWQAEFAV